MLEPTPGDLAGRCSSRLSGRHPLVGALAVAAAGYVVMLAVLVGLGLLVTRVLVDTAVGRWDESVIDWLARHRTPLFDDLTMVGSHLAETPTVVLVATVVAVYLLVRHFAQGALLLAVGLVVEVSVFLTTTLLVPRDRPDVPKLDQVPPTSSFPSGHTAAAVVLFVCLGLLSRARLRHAFVCRVVWGLALLVPVVVALSRMYRGMHHPADVLAGMVLGVGALVVAVTAVRVALVLAGCGTSRVGPPPSPATTGAP